MTTDRMPIRKPITLASGRTIAFTYLANGAQDAIPTTGPRWMTLEEGAEFEERIDETTPGRLDFVGTQCNACGAYTYAPCNCIEEGAA